jgi:hypothetical protein
MDALPDEILHNIGRFIIETERTEKSSSIVSATHFYFVAIGQLNWNFYERVHNPSFWIHDTFSIVLRNNKFNDNDEEHEKENNLLTHLLELMKHVHFSSINLVAYKHSIFVNDLIYKGIMLFPEISESLTRLSVNCYLLPPLENLLPVIEKCEKLKELKLEFSTTRKSKSSLSYDNEQELVYKIQPTTLESITMICPPYDHPEFVAELVRASPLLKTCTLNMKRILWTVPYHLKNCKHLESVHLTCNHFAISEEDLIEFIRDTKLKHVTFAYAESEAFTVPVLQEITTSWADTLESLKIHSQQYPFRDQDLSYKLTVCNKLHTLDIAKTVADDYWYQYQFDTIQTIEARHAWVEKFIKEACTNDALRNLRLFSILPKDETPLHFGTSVQNLKSLSVIGLLSEDCFLNIVKQTERLEELHYTFGRLHGFLSEDDTGRLQLDKMVGLCPNVKIVNCTAAAGPLSALASLHEMTHLELALQRRSIPDLKKDSLPNVRTLTIKMFDDGEVMTQALYDTISACPNIQHLSILLGNDRIYYGPEFQDILLKALELAPAVKTIQVQSEMFRIPCDVKHKSIVALTNSRKIVHFFKKDLAIVLSWMMICVDINKYNLEQFIEKEKFTDVLQSFIEDLELVDEEDDAEAIWKLFMHIVETYGQDAFENKITGEKTQEMYDQFIEFAKSKENVYKKRDQTVVQEGERGWELTLPQLYDLIANIYPTIKGEDTSMGLFG